MRKCDGCGQRWCDECAEHFADCACPGPHDEEPEPMTITYTEAAVLLGVSGRTVSRLVKSGELTPVPITDDNGRPAFRLDRDAVERLALARVKNGGAE